MHTVKKVLLTALLPFLSQLATANPDKGTATLSQPALSFIENKGQITDQYRNLRSDIDYKLSAQGINIFIGDGQLHYQWSKTDNPLIEQDKKGGLKMPAPVDVTTYRMDVTLVGANRDAVVIAEQLQKDKETYYFPGIGKDGLTANLYRKITYKEVYPYIDWILYSNGTELKYDFVVHPGGNPKDIKLQFAGATSLQMQNGNLVAATPFGNITEQKPYSYNAETRERVPSSFSLQGNVLSFNVSSINSTLVIDPVIAWGTYYGDVLDEYIAVGKNDLNGNTYLCGATYSAANIATVGTYQTTFAGNTDGFVAKINTNGQRIWGTYFGSTDYEAFPALDVDKFGNVYTGTTGDDDLQSLVTPGAHQPTYGSTFPHYDAMLVKFDANGQRVWATYYGGYLNDQLDGVVCDTSGNVYFSGITYSNTDMVTPGTQKTTMGAPQLYLVKFNGAGQRQWGTYYGGSDGYQTYLSDLTVDNVGNPIISGYTSSNSSSDLSTPGCFQSTNSGGQRDAVIAKYNKSNGLYIWASYYGAAYEDAIYETRSDDNGNTYIVGYTENSTGFAGSTGSHQPLPGGAEDGFIAKFNNSGQRVWGTYYGGSNGDYCQSIFVKGNTLIVWGFSASTTGISTPGSQYATLGTNKSFYAIFNTSGQRSYGSYFPLQGNVTMDVFGNTYLSGVTMASTGIGTPGTYQPSLSGGKDAFVIKLGPDTAVAINQPFTDTLFCPGSVFNLNYTVTGGFNTGNTFTAQLSDATGSFSSPIDIGVATATTSGSISCTIPASTPVGNGYRIRIVASNPLFTSMDDGYDIRIQTSVIPAVSVVAVPGTDVGPWISVTFTATPTAGGTTPVYQWRKNGADISGATSNTYTGIMNIDLVTGDVITVKMISNESCAMPDSAISPALTINVNLSVADMEAGALKVYPNPTNGLLHITGTNEAMELMLYNAMGQIVLSEKQPATATGKHTISFKGVAAGLYMLKVKTGSETETVRISVQQ